MRLSVLAMAAAFAVSEASLPPPIDRAYFERVKKPKAQAHPNKKKFRKAQRKARATNKGKRK